MIIMGVDLGHARTGLSVCDKSEFLASPAGVIYEKNDKHLLTKICDALTEKKAEMVVVGYPKNMDGSCGEAAQRAEQFAKNIEENTKIPVKLWDERCSTKVAHTYLNSTDTRGKKRKAVVDELSAVIILQDFLDSRK